MKKNAYPIHPIHPIRTITVPPHACNRHSVNRHRHVRRGFLPRGLFDTCPPFTGITSRVCQAGSIEQT